MEDPDAANGIFTHWIIFNIPPTITDLPESLPPVKKLINADRQGTNDAGKIGYIGPCPPNGTHHYQFRLYALSEMLDLNPGIKREEFLKAIKGKILAIGEIQGTYRRNKS